MSRIRAFIGQLKERGVRRTLTIYMSSALTAIGIVKLFSEVYGLSPSIFPVIVTILTFGLASAFLYAWFHGKEGSRRIQLKEIALHSIVVAVAVFVSFQIGGARRPPHLLADNGEVPSVAILYLKNLGLETDEPYSYGITQDLIVDIAKAGLVRVAPMKDVLSLQSSTMPIDSIALKLRVRYVLDGSLKRIGDMLQLSGQIVEATTGITLWADRLQTKASDVTHLQGQLAQAIIKALNLEPSEVIKKDITKSRTMNPEAYEFYLRANYLFQKKKTKEDVATARGMYQQAIDLDAEFVQALLGKGTTHTFQGDYGGAEQLYERALHIARQSNEKNEEATSLSLLGVLEWYRGNYSKALAYYTQSLSIAQEIGDRAGEGKTLNNIAVVYSAQGDHTTALEYYARSLKRAQELGDRLAEGNALSNNANVYYLKGDYSRALDYYAQTLKTFQELHDRRGEGMTLNSIGTALRSQGAYDKALEYYARSLRVKQDLGDRRGEGFTLNDIGIVHDEQSNYERALEYYNQSLDIAQEVGDEIGQGYAFWSIGGVALKQARHGRAIEYLKKAETLFARMDATPERMSALSWLALAEVRNKNPRSAQANMDSVERLLKVVPRPDELIGICWNLYQVNALLGNSQKASQYLQYAYEEVTQRAEGIRDTLMRQSYLANVKTNREVVAAWKKQKETL